MGVLGFDKIQIDGYELLESFSKGSDAELQSMADFIINSPNKDADAAKITDVATYREYLDKKMAKMRANRETPAASRAEDLNPTTFEQLIDQTEVEQAVYDSPIDETTGKLDEDLQVKNKYNSKYFDEMKSYVEGGDSPWLAAQQADIASQADESLGSLGAQQASGLQEAEQGLAMRRGLTGGAASRMQEYGDEQSMFARQDINRNKGMQNASVRAMEAADKNEAAKLLPGLSLDAAAYNTETDMTNIGNLVAQKQKDRDIEMNKYKTDMGTWFSHQLGSNMKKREGWG